MLERTMAATKDLFNGKIHEVVGHRMMLNQLSGYSHPEIEGGGRTVDEGKFVVACLYSFLLEVCVTLINFDLFVRKLVGVTNLLCQLTKNLFNFILSILLYCPV